MICKPRFYLYTNPMDVSNFYDDTKMSRLGFLSLDFGAFDLVLFADEAEDGTITVKTINGKHLTISEVMECLTNIQTFKPEKKYQYDDSTCFTFKEISFDFFRLSGLVCDF